MAVARGLWEGCEDSGESEDPPGSRVGGLGKGVEAGGGREGMGSGVSPVDLPGEGLGGGRIMWGGVGRSSLGLTPFSHE